LAALPWLGTALPVVVHAPGVELPVPGSWIKLRNGAGVLAAAAQLQGVFTRASSWAPWQPEAALEANYRQRLAAGGPQGVARWAPPSAQWRAACDRPDQPFTSLRRVLGDVPGAAPALYRCLVRLVAHTPGEGALGRMCVRAEACWDAARAEGYRDREAWLFAGSLLLDDATGRVTGDLFGRDAERFLARVTPPCDLAANDRTRERLRAALAACKGTQGAAGCARPPCLARCPLFCGPLFCEHSRYLAVLPRAAAQGRRALDGCRPGFLLPGPAGPVGHGAVPRAPLPARAGAGVGCSARLLAALQLNALL
jgi:hypothetical protein